MRKPFQALAGLNNRRQGKFKVYQNAKGEWCLGNKCFTMKATDEGVKVRFNTNNPSCPTNLKEAAAKLLEVVKAGKETTYIMPKPPQDGEEW